MKKVKIFEICLLTALIFAVVLGAYAQEQSDKLAGSIIRLHVLPNSNTNADQNLKLIVRNSVLAKAGALIKGAKTAGQAAQIIAQNLAQINQTAQQTVYDHGYTYTTKTVLDTSFFNTRYYTDFSMPAGEYNALRVTIGAGQGNNWWCVVFPPLCVNSAVEQTAADHGLDQEQTELITSQQPEVKVKFKIIEIYQSIKNALT